MNFESKDNQKNWDKAVLKENSYFMQSFLWGEFRKKIGIPIFRIKDKKSFIQVEKRRLPFGKCYFYIAGTLLNHKTCDLKPLLSSLIKLAKKEKAIFIKIETLKSSRSSVKKLQLQNLSPSKTSKDKLSSVESNNIQPKNTLILDISPTEEKLLASFHQKHRYNIRLAQKKNIDVRVIESKKEFERFYELIKKTDERKHISSFAKNYYENLFELSREESSLKVVFLGAYLKKEIAAGIILIIWGETATYLVGASDYKYRKYMAPHLLQFEAMKLSKKLGAKTYDFWGIIKESDFASKKDFERHHWAGITRFKNGFDGKEVGFDTAQDYIINPFWYKLYILAKKLRNKSS